MKTKITDPKKEFLLGAGLDVLHQESKEWQENIAFWQDETKFFNTILTKKERQESEYTSLLKNLERVHHHLFNFMSKDIIEHEKFLSRLVKGEKGLSDENYRGQHKELKEKMEVFNQDFKTFKKMVFAYVKKL
ncbi:hypothetical protein [Cellulophaga sp. Hel_I_12]|uniref:hypothetical protein n=1 Tax=Cellulophaga sp. Hel_I_12 TaxID=1249972 RepID=UPI000648E00D|nr:hypothetical protein [Cellulophaga sp. Hel_I_12]